MDENVCKFEKFLKLCVVLALTTFGWFWTENYYVTGSKLAFCSVGGDVERPKPARKCTTCVQCKIGLKWCSRSPVSSTSSYYSPPYSSSSFPAPTSSYSSYPAPTSSFSYSSYPASSSNYPAPSFHPGYQTNIIIDPYAEVRCLISLLDPYAEVRCLISLLDYTHDLAELRIRTIF